MASASPAAKSLLAQATAAWPNRVKASDGLMPSAAHLKASPHSDHNAGNAVDLSRDDRCFNATTVSRALANDPRSKYVIYNGQIWSRALRIFGWRKYTGTNKHTKHIHISIYDAKRSDVSRWSCLAVEPVLTLSISKNRANIKEGYVLSGAISPVVANAPMVISYRRPGEALWRAWITVPTDASGHFSVGTRGYRLGTYTYRVMFPGDATHAVGRYVYDTVEIVR